MVFFPCQNWAQLEFHEFWADGHASSVMSLILSLDCTRTSTCVIVAAADSCAGDEHATVIKDVEPSVSSWLWATFTDLKTS